MRFTTEPPPRDEPDDPAVLHIGGPAGRRRTFVAWSAAVAALAAVLIGAFVWFGTTLGCSAVLVALMLAYMAAMARWAGGEG